MPLARPTSTTTSLNFGSEPFLVVKFMTGDPGEAFGQASPSQTRKSWSDILMGFAEPDFPKGKHASRVDSLVVVASA